MAHARNPVAFPAVRSTKKPFICWIDPPTKAATRSSRYAANINDLHRRAATDVDKILRGAEPADLPVEQGSGLEIPAQIVARADEVIE